MPIRDRHIRGWVFLLFLTGLVLQACSIKPWQPSSGPASSSEALHTRLLDVSYPLLTAAADWCPFDQEQTYGFLLQEDGRGESPELSPPQARAVVAYVHPRLPAALAGLMVKDEIVQVNTVHVRGATADSVGQLIGRLTRAKIQPLQLEILRGGASRTIVVSAMPACHYGMRVLDTDLINGITDGRQIGVTRGAMRFFTADDEMAWVVAHEIAHNILQHSQNEKLQAMLGAFLAARGEVRGPTHTILPRPSLESQADYVGAYVMARAGYDLTAIKRVWDQLERLESRQTGRKPGLAQTHPPTKDRRAAFEVTLSEIEATRQAGQLFDFRIEGGH